MRFCFIPVTIMLLLCSRCLSYSQYGNIWAFGDSAGIDFNTSPPTPVATHISTREGSASICDASGKLLFYTDGTTVWDRSHNIMPNGTNLPGYWQNITASTSQGALIIPIPGNTSRYYVFSLGNWEHSLYVGRLYYSIVDMTLNGGMGDVVPDSKGKLLAVGLTEQMTAVSGNNCNIWLLTASRLDPHIYAYNVSFDDIDTIPVTSPYIPGGGMYGGIIGTVDVSPDRTKIAFAQGNLVLYDFDATTGKAANPVILERQFALEMYGVAFSPGNSKLYATATPNGAERGTYQFDVSINDTQQIIASKIKISVSNRDWAIKRAPDSKMYIANTGEYISVIHNPDMQGVACGYEANSFFFPVGRSMLGLPNTATIVVNKKNYTAQTDTIFCVDSFILSAHNIAAMNYLWQDGSLDNTLKIDTSGTYWVSYQDVSYQGAVSECIDYVDTFHIVLYKNQKLYSSTVLNGMCKADTLLLQAGHPDAGDYIWEDNFMGRTKVARREGTYWVNYRIDALCEFHSDTFIVRYPERDYELSFATDTLGCVDEPVTFRNTSEEPFDRFHWSYGDGNGSTVHSPQYSYTRTGTYEVKLTGWIGDRCADSVINYITVDSIFSLSLRSDRNEICVGETVNFYPNTDRNTLALHWQFDDQEGMTTSNGIQYQHAYAHPGTFPVQLTAHNRACPDTEITDTIEVYALPYIDLGTDSSICWQGQLVILENKAALSGGSYRYQWSTGDTTATLQVNHHGTYSLTIIHEPVSCSNTESIEIAKDCYVDIPNAFTPNGDGHNDYFFPRQLLSKNVTAFKMQIFNRWGQLIFATQKTEGRGWDGKSNGIDQPEGVYLYQLVAEIKGGKTEYYQGNITLIR